MNNEIKMGYGSIAMSTEYCGDKAALILSDADECRPIGKT